MDGGRFDVCPCTGHIAAVRTLVALRRSFNSPPAAFPPADAERHGAIVLVHGAWVGEWCWSPLLPRLRRSQRPVHAVTLRGHGARRHESGPDITLTDHVDDLVGLVETHDLRDITLVGHSYGGRVVTRSLDRLAERLVAVVFVDAHAPIGGDDTMDSTRATAHDVDERGMIPFGEFEPDPVEFGGPESVAWFLRRTMPQSAKTLDEPFRTALSPDLDLTYVHATRDSGSRFAGYAAAARADPAWHYVELPGSHWLMVSHPRELATIIVDAAQRCDDRQRDIRTRDSRRKANRP